MASAHVVCGVEVDVQIFAIVPEFLIRAPLVIVRPLAIYPAAAVPPATAYYQLHYHYLLPPPRLSIEWKIWIKRKTNVHLQVT
jgi:hypothetical protein